MSRGTQMKRLTREIGDQVSGCPMWMKEDVSTQTDPITTVADLTSTPEAVCDNHLHHSSEEEPMVDTVDHDGDWMPFAGDINLDEPDM